MAAHFRMADADIRSCGVDDSTPPGHCTAIGIDSLGRMWLWLFQGAAPSDEAYVGAVQIPERAGQTPNAYGRTGAWEGVALDTKAALERLAAKVAV
ncbi:hypothetical protein ACLF6K_37565 [Streptomyces xanthophaeus]|uniref:hypothetical protein n=1 Tax=Streptomyces xanthophaeus TaxID=67385 RepID=UPI00398FBC1B